MRGYDEDFSGTLAPTRPQRRPVPPCSSTSRTLTQQLVLHSGVAPDCYLDPGVTPALRGSALRRCRPRTCAPLFVVVAPFAACGPKPARARCCCCPCGCGGSLVPPGAVGHAPGPCPARTCMSPHCRAAVPRTVRACVPVCLARAVADADAALTYPVRAGELKKGSYVVIQGHPCKVRKGCRVCHAVVLAPPRPCPRAHAHNPACPPACARAHNKGGYVGGRPWEQEGLACVCSVWGRGGGGGSCLWERGRAVAREGRTRQWL